MRGGLFHGFQLWVNLPAREKLTAPRYQDIPPEKIPEVALGHGVRVRVIAGEAGGVRGPAEGIATHPSYLDLHLSPRSSFSHEIPAGQTAFAYVYEGRTAFGPRGKTRDVGAGQLAVLSDGERLSASAGETAARFLLLAARPLREPIARYGPFVMNTREEIEQALRDYQSGALTAA